MQRLFEQLKPDFEGRQNLQIKLEARKNYLESLKERYKQANQDLLYEKLKFVNEFKNKKIEELRSDEQEVLNRLEAINKNLERISQGELPEAENKELERNEKRGLADFDRQRDKLKILDYKFPDDFFEDDLFERNLDWKVARTHWIILSKRAFNDTTEERANIAKKHFLPCANLTSLFTIKCAYHLKTGKFLHANTDNLMFLEGEMLRKEDYKIVHMMKFENNCWVPQESTERGHHAVLTNTRHNLIDINPQASLRSGSIMYSQILPFDSFTRKEESDYQTPLAPRDKKA
jgi:hypothetical protein